MTRGTLGKHELTLKQWHHGYLGLIIIALGWYLHSELVRTVGRLILYDDVFQHLIQWLWIDNYHSPLRVFYEKLIWEPLHRGDKTSL